MTQTKYAIQIGDHPKGPLFGTLQEAREAVKNIQIYEVEIDDEDKFVKSTPVAR